MAHQMMDYWVSFASSPDANPNANVTGIRSWVSVCLCAVYFGGNQRLSLPRSAPQKKKYNARHLLLSIRLTQSHTLTGWNRVEWPAYTAQTLKNIRLATPVSAEDSYLGEYCPTWNEVTFFRLGGCCCRVGVVVVVVWLWLLMFVRAV